ncbi:MAG TPA: hypothetical protein DCS15_01095 [Flavobacteriales bacterium]|jgi:hypothetical protein|nr:hypothetical protein [Salibacteraceae bacterium]HAS35052.1 hypothetical protein [Flavobacteriales bacterium]
MRLHLLFFLFLLPLFGKAQIHCGLVAFEPSDPVQLNLKFDSFQEYEAGVTIYGVANLRIRVDDQAPADPLCRWFLNMEIGNNPGAGTASTDWETLSQYGVGPADPPTLDILEVRVTNQCATSPINGVFASYFADHGDIQDIIADLLPRINAGACATNVNGPGNYLSNYNEFTFRVDVRVRPNLDFKPGVYQCNLKFHLQEQN